MKKQQFYVTTPIYYINDIATIGHFYTTMIADVLARWHRLKGEDVFFLTGTDENSQKTVKAAQEKLGKTSLTRKEIQAYADQMAETWKETWKKLHIAYDGFIRTTDAEHEKLVNEIFMKVHAKGDIYKSTYTGLYCEGCEAFYLEKDLVEGKCIYHKKEPKKISEENYFFRLSKYQQQILTHIQQHPEFVQPVSRRNEVIRFIEEEGIKDISVSRPTKLWGLPLPIDKNHVHWTWFDALLNYISGAPKHWPATIQLLGKDILRFHAIIFPGILLSAGYPLPTTLFIHGFLTINGQKMSKSLGNAINPFSLVEKYGLDPLRYFLLREIPFGEDGDFSETALKNRLNNELANDLGNLLSRTLTLAEKYCEGKVPKGKNALPFTLQTLDARMAKYQLNEALADLWKYIQTINKYINDTKPWEAKEKEGILYTALDSLRIVSILLFPFLPDTAEKIAKQLGTKIGKLADAQPNLLKAGTILKKEGILFPKIP